ncbi:hypothetical protein [Actinoplanes sp. NPDC051494]|uniref:hypothetical protein n=1 Tax=Actinoplanes sp. NPDC051494 TaxID=3363907 RepID=UPI00378A4D24
MGARMLTVDSRRHERWRRAAVAGLLVVGMVTGTASAASATQPDPDGGDTPITEAPTEPPRSLDELAQQIEPVACPQPGPGGPALGTGVGAPPPGKRVVRIVITGDSYMSGEGAGDYYNARGVLTPPAVGPVGGLPIPAPGFSLADYQADYRHRSANAAALLAIEELRRVNPDVVFDVTFNASSGAETKHYWAGQNDNGRVNPPQSTGITAQTDLVIAGFGGNDLGFGGLIEKAVIDSGEYPLRQALAGKAGLLAYRSAEAEWADAVTSATPSTLVARYIKMVRDMHLRSGTQTRVLAVGYPQGVDIAKDDPYFDREERKVLAEMAPKLTAALARAQEILVSNGIQVDRLDTQRSFRGHELGTADPFVNGVRFSVTGGSGTLFNHFQETAHPNRRGNQFLAALYVQTFAAELHVKAPGQRDAIRVGQPARSCQPGLFTWPVPATGTGTGGGGGTAGGGNTGPEPGAGGYTPPTGGDFPEPGVPEPGDGDTGGDDGSAGYPDLDPVTPVQPTEPSIPDGLEGATPVIPTVPPAGGGAPGRNNHNSSTIDLGTVTG